MRSISDKPLKTVESLDEILDHLGERCIMQEHGLTDRPKSDEIQVAKNRLYQLMLSLVGGTKGVKELFPDVNLNLRNDELVDAIMKKEGYNIAIKNITAKLSEHFNGEGEV